MTTKIYIAPYIRGPELPPCTPASQDPRLPSRPWAYRVTNFARQRLDWLMARLPGNTAVIECHPVYELDAVSPEELKPGDIILVEAGQTIVANGTIVEGMALIDEAAISGQSTPVFRETGGDADVMRDSVVIEGRILVQVSARLGHPLDWITAPQR